jgi:catechol 2,3-dioxygenase-like lactoylglutathione lyase family enzyme
MNAPTRAATGTIELQAVCPLLFVFDMPASLRFYRDVLEFEIIGSAPPGAADDAFGWVWLRRGDAELMLNTAYDPDAVRPPHADVRRVDAHADTALFFGCPDPDAVYRHLRERGVEAHEPQITHYGMKQLHVRDPDGFALCFQCPA